MGLQAVVFVWLYTYCFTVYRGKQGEVRSSNGLAYDVVVDLVKGLENQGYRLFTDNFYSSPILFEYLKANGFEACSTIDIKRLNVPKYLKSLKTELAKVCTERGEGRWVWDKSLVYVMWTDTKVVTVASTMHTATGNEKVIRKMKDKAGQLLRKEVKIPPPIVEYNKYMGGVDLLDQGISYYNILCKTRKYWRTLFCIFFGRNGDQFIYSVQIPPTWRGMQKMYSQSISGEFGNSVIRPKRWFWKKTYYLLHTNRVLGLLTSLHTLLMKSDNIVICAKYWRNPDSAPDWSVLHVICIFALNPTETASKFGILVNVTIWGTKTCWNKYLFSARI